MSKKKTPAKTTKGTTRNVANADTTAAEEPRANEAPEDASGSSIKETGHSEVEMNHDSVAALATQIVSAQIGGIAQHETLVAIWGELRSALVAITTVVAEVQGGGDATASVARLRERLGRRWLNIPKPNVLGPVGAIELDRLFQSALRRSSKMVARTFVADPRIYAEQIFEPDELLSENGISDRFERWKWSGLLSRAPLIDLMTDVDRWFAERVQAHRSLSADETDSTDFSPEENDLRALIRAKEICEKVIASNEHTNADYREAASALDSLLRNRNQYEIQAMTERLSKFYSRPLIHFMYGGSDPKERYDGRSRNSAAGGGGGAKPKSQPRMYRPWGIFRFLRLHGQEPSDELGLVLNEKLRTRNYDRNRYPEVIGLYPIEYAFGPLGFSDEDEFDEVEFEKFENDEMEGEESLSQGLGSAKQ